MSYNKTPKEILKAYFGYDSFREKQDEIITSLLHGDDILAIMPTGAGKSLCYQIPAMLLEGITIVISPLISLMQDQVKALNDIGIKAAYINSTLTERQMSKALSLSKSGEYKIIYVAPERLEAPSFRFFAENADIALVAVDEAHCVSQWGQDFRPSYLNISGFITSLPKRPKVGAFTATATADVKKDIANMLGLENPRIFVTGFDRPNLYFEVNPTSAKNEYVLNYIKSHPNDSGIIYCATRKNVDRLCELLKSTGLKVAKYHAGMSDTDRRNFQNDFICDRIQVMIATNAFGMGIDKSNVRFVIHYNMPQSIENYYQEAGRAGRDGEPASCILLFSPQDIIINRFLLENKSFSDMEQNEIENVKGKDFFRLNRMIQYCETSLCLRGNILEYFGEKPISDCGNCGSCLLQFDEIDMTDNAKKVINCIVELHRNYGAAIITGTLCGANRARLREIGATSMRTYGTVTDSDEKKLGRLIDAMVEKNLLLRDGEYRTLSVGPNAMSLKNPENRVMLKERSRTATERFSKKCIVEYNELSSSAKELFERLRSLRFEIAEKEKLPPYVVFSDKALHDMCKLLPKSKAEMLDVYGVGEIKFEKYGKVFLSEIAGFNKTHPELAQAKTEYDTEMKNAAKTLKPIKKREKEAFYLTEEEFNALHFEEYLFVSDIRKLLNDASGGENIKRLSYGDINDFLIENDYISYATIDSEKKKQPTEKGYLNGIKETEHKSSKGEIYRLIMYPENIQREIARYFVKIER